MFLSPEAQTSRFEAQARETGWWPTLKVTRTRAIITRPCNGAREFAARIKAKHSGLLMYDASKGHWWAPITAIGDVHAAFAPRLHLSKGAWLVLEDRGEQPRGRLLLSPEEEVAVTRRQTTVEEVLDRARVELYG